MMKRSIRRARRLKVALSTTDGIFAPGDVAQHFSLAVRAEFGIRAAQDLAGIIGIVFEAEPFKSRVEFRFRTGNGVGGRRCGRVRMQRRAQQDSVLNFGRSPRFLGRRTGQATIFSRAGLAALCGMWTGDLKQSGVYIGHNRTF